jgi:RNA polymerase sigma-70 factor (ECF subfamily)
VPDESLEDRFARRDAMAYETAYHVFAPRMYATAMRLLRDPDTANECVHDVFLRLWDRRNAYASTRGSLEAFLVTCARNQALTKLRSAKRFVAASEALNREESYTVEEDPIERDRVARALGQLTNGQSDVVQLAYYRGLTLSEVAAELAIPIGTVKGRLAAALRALRRTLVVETS